MSEPIKQTIEKITSVFQDSNETAVVFILTFVTTIVIVGIGIYIYYMINLQNNQCSLLEKMNPSKNTVIKSVLPNEYRLRDYHIKSAYNCCSLGTYKNNYVGICGLKNVLIQGVRGLDFEIFSIDNKPVIATSLSENYHSKDTLNYVLFEEALDYICKNAFNNLMVNNSNDPILIHLRFKSNNIQMYDKLALILSRYQSYFVDRQYNNMNLGSVPLKYLMGKICIIVNDSNKTYRDCEELLEFINLKSGSGQMRIHTFSDLKNGDINQRTELVNYNKKYMTICLPDKEDNLDNPDITYFRDTGCNMFCLKYQKLDKNMVFNNEFFKDCAFVLKKPILRDNNVGTKDVVINVVPTMNVNNTKTIVKTSNVPSSVAMNQETVMINPSASAQQTSTSQQKNTAQQSTPQMRQQPSQRIQQGFAKRQSSLLDNKNQNNADSDWKKNKKAKKN